MYKNDIHQIIRVDHAGELGAKWIYEGQLRWIKDPAMKVEIQHMYDQEKLHLSYFEALMHTYQVRPTALMFFWKWIGKTTGAISAVLGSRAAMAYTEAVEEVIDVHYEQQINTLTKEHSDEINLIATLKQFRNDECNHKNTAAEYNQHSDLISEVLKNAIKIGVRTAIKLSKHI
jgi:ubiquinone biosynthesis monooxygenase Coq7